MKFLQEILDIILHYSKPLRDFLSDMLRRVLALFNRTLKESAQSANNNQELVNAKPRFISDALDKLKANPNSMTLALDFFRELEAKALAELKQEEIRKKQMNRPTWH